MLVQGKDGHDQTDLRVKPENVATDRSSELLAKVELEDLDLILRERRRCWFGHVEHFSGAVRIACDIQVDVRHSDSLISCTILGLWVLRLAVSHINESQLQTYESRTLFLMTSLKYHCINASWDSLK